MKLRLTEVNRDNISHFAPLFPAVLYGEFQNSVAQWAIGAVMEDTACGVLVYEHEENEILIRHLAVSDDFRRKGAATKLVTALAIASGRRGMMLRAEFFSDEKGKKDALLPFFKSLPFCTLTEEDGGIYHAERKLLESSALTKYAERAGDFGKLFFDLSVPARRGILSVIGIEETVLGDPGHAEKALCLFSGTQKEPTAFVYCERKGKDRLHLNYVWCAVGSETALIFLLSRVLEEALAKNPPVKRVEMAAVTVVSEHLLHRLLPGAKKIMRYYSCVYDAQRAAETGE